MLKEEEGCLTVKKNIAVRERCFTFLLSCDEICIYKSGNRYRICFCEFSQFVCFTFLSAFIPRDK